MEEMQQENTAVEPVVEPEAAVTGAEQTTAQLPESTEEIADTAIEGEPGVAEEAAPEAAEESIAAININSDMPQESDPVVSGEMKELIDEMIDPVPPVAPVVEDSASQPPVIEEVVALSEEEAYLEKIKATGTEAQQRMLAAIENFALRLRPKAAITPEDCNKAQYELLRHLMWLLKKDYDTFRGGWNALLIYFSVNHGLPTPVEYSALSEYSTFRYLSSWARTQEECNLYVNLVTVLRATRNRATRKHDIKMISIDKVGVGLLGDKEVSNLKQFYEA